MDEVSILAKGWSASWLDEGFPSLPPEGASVEFVEFWFVLLAVPMTRPVEECLKRVKLWLVVAKRACLKKLLVPLLKDPKKERKGKRYKFEYWLVSIQL